MKTPNWKVALAAGGPSGRPILVEGTSTTLDLGGSVDRVDRTADLLAASPSVDPADATTTGYRTTIPFDDSIGSVDGVGDSGDASADASLDSAPNASGASVDSVDSVDSAPAVVPAPPPPPPPAPATAAPAPPPPPADDSVDSWSAASVDSASAS